VASRLSVPSALELYAIDRVFFSDSIRQDVIEGVIHDSGVNLSDRIPLIYSFKFDLKIQPKMHVTVNIRASGNSLFENPKSPRQ